MAQFHNLPRIMLPNLGYETLRPRDRAALFSLFGEMSQLQADFRSLWNSVYYSHELDRTSIHMTGVRFAILEHGLVRSNVLPKPSENLHGVYVDDLLSTAREGFPEMVTSLTGDATLALMHILDIQNERAVIVERGVFTVRNIILDMVLTVKRFRHMVRREVAEMDTFVRRTQTRTDVMEARPRRMLVSNNVADKLLVGCISQITHMRVRLDFVITNASRCMSLQFNPAWGDTARRWIERGLNVQWWGPSQSQVSEEGTVSQDFNIYVWNVMGAMNPALQNNLLFIKERVWPKMMIFSSTLAPCSMIHRVKAILGFRGGRAIDRNGGVWLVWDSSALEVQFNDDDTDAVDMVMVLRGC